MGPYFGLVSNLGTGLLTNQSGPVRSQSHSPVRSVYSFTRIGFSLRLLSVMAPAYTVAIIVAFISHMVVIHNGFIVHVVATPIGFILHTDVIRDSFCLHSCYLQWLLPVQYILTTYWLDCLHPVGVTIVSYSKDI